MLYKVTLVLNEFPSFLLQEPSYFGLPGVGINAGMMMMNLTRMRYLAGGGSVETIR